MPDTMKIPIFSGSLKKMLGEIPGPVAEELKKLTNLINPEDWLKECACPECKEELATKNKHAHLFNQACGMNYFSYREKEGMVSYLPDGKELEIKSDGNWGRKCRQETAPGKWAQKILTSSLNQKDLKDFTDLFLKKEAEEKISIHIVSVQEAYDGPVHSCMKGSPVGAFYELFGAKAVIAKQHGKMAARAVLWENIEGQPDGQVAPLMDRVYPCEGPITMAMFEHATKQGWWRKTSQSAGQTSVLHSVHGGAFCNGWKIRNLYPDKTVNQKRLRYGLKNLFFPYMDTFSKSDKDLTYITPKTVPAGWIYQNQSGLRVRDCTGLIKDYSTEEYFEEDIGVRLNGYTYAPWNVFTCSITGEQFTIRDGYQIRHPDGTISYISSSALQSIRYPEDENAF